MCAHWGISILASPVLFRCLGTTHSSQRKRHSNTQCHVRLIKQSAKLWTLGSFTYKPAYLFLFLDSSSHRAHSPRSSPQRLIQVNHSRCSSRKPTLELHGYVSAFVESCLSFSRFCLPLDVVFKDKLLLNLILSCSLSSLSRSPPSQKRGWGICANSLRVKEGAGTRYAAAQVGK